VARKREAKSEAMTKPKGEGVGVVGAEGVLDDDDGYLPLDASIARQLIRDIAIGIYQPGQWIREQEVATRFKVSRSPVREAFRQVQQQGFILVRPWRGAKVLELSVQDTGHIFDLLEAIYGASMRIAADAVPRERFKELDEMLERAMDAVARNSLPDRIAIAFQIGRRLSRWSGSQLAHDMLNRVGSLALWQHRFLEFDEPGAAERTVELHRRLIGAVKERNPSEAESCARQIISLTRRMLIPRVRPTTHNLQK
jgi:GntR family transcriptional regulator, rspAB operon transcriptional repressor